MTILLRMGKHLYIVVVVVVMFLSNQSILRIAAEAQEPEPSWQEEVRRLVEEKNWDRAMSIVNREIARSPQDMDVRTWHARVLLWSGKIGEAEVEYREIVAAVPQDPDGWLGLASVLVRAGRDEDGLEALNHAAELAPHRADIRLARARALQTLKFQDEAKVEVRRAVELGAPEAETRLAIASFETEHRHELRVGTNTDQFNFADANQNESLTLKSRWTPRWETVLFMDGYQWTGTDAEKCGATLTRKFHVAGALTAGGAVGHDNGVIPRNEAIFEYDKGFAVDRKSFIRGVEIIYGQHWYWYRTAQIFTIRETTLFYLPRDWTWSFQLSGARSHFPQIGSEWRPSGTSRLGFPIKSWEEHGLGGHVFFAVGTESFGRVDQIGNFSSHTYGGDLRLQLTKQQDVMGFAAYQMRSLSRTERSFGFSYGFRF